MQHKLINLVEATWFTRFVIIVIILNAITLGLETAPDLVGEWMPTLLLLDTIFLTIFTVEIALKLVAYRHRFFASGWNNFDFWIVVISYLPFIEGLSVLRALRILRVFRLLSVVPQFRRVTQAFFAALSGLGAVGAILLLIFYVGSVMATKLFGETFPEWFGSIGASMFSLFQIMTLESWSSAIARPVMEVYPYAWVFFVAFILATTFAALNLLIGVIVNSMQSLATENTQDDRDSSIDGQTTDNSQLRAEVEQLERMVQELKRKL